MVSFDTYPFDMVTPKKKILYVITKSNYGGAQRYVFDLASHLAPDEYDVAVAFGGTGSKGASIGTLSERLTHAGIRTIAIRHFMRDVSLFEDVRAFFELVRIIRAERPDVLHVTSSKAGGLGALAGRLMRVPRIVFTSHGLTFDESWRPLWQRALIWLFTWGTVMLSHASIMISRETYARARALPFVGSKVALVYNGIVPPHFLSRDTARTKLGVTTDSTTAIIGTIGELHPNKNQHLLIEALTELKTQGLLPHLILMGEGEERARLEALASARGVSTQVHLLGYVHDAATYLPALDIFVLPSVKEGLPYVLMEAGYAGLPTIASDISGNRDIVVHDESGLLVDTTPSALAQALSRYLTDSSLAHTQGATLQARVQALFSIDTMLSGTIALYTPSRPATSRSRSSRRTER